MPSVDEFLDAPPKPDRLDAFLDEPAPVAKPDALDAFLDEPPLTQAQKEKRLRDAAGVVEIDPLTKFASGMSTGITKGLRTPERLLTGAADLILGSVGAGDTALGKKVAGKLKEYSEWDSILSERDRQMFGEGDVAGNLGAGVGQGLAELPMQVIPGAGASTPVQAVTRSALAGGVIGGGNQYAQERGEGKGRDVAALQGALSGAITAATTKRFGTTGIESIFKKEGVKGLMPAVREVAKNTLGEITEEAADQLQQDLAARISKNLDKSIEDSIREVLMAGAIGGIIGGGVSAVSQGVGSLGGNQQPPQPPQNTETAVPPVGPQSQPPVTPPTVAPVAPAPAASPTIPVEASKLSPEVVKFEQDFNDPAVRQDNRDTIKTGMSVRSIDDLNSMLELLAKARANPDLKWTQQLPREVIEQAVNIGSASSDLNLPELPEFKGKARPLDWKKNPEVEAWLRKNEKLLWPNKSFDEISGKVPEESFEDFKKREDARKAALASAKPQGAGQPPVAANIPPVVGAQPEAPGAFPKRGPSFKKDDLKPGENIFAKVVAQSVEFKGRISEWLKGKPENKAIVWEESPHSDKNPGNVKALTRNIGEKPWRVTTYWNRDGKYIPSGHREYSNRLEAMAAEGGDVAKLHDSMPGRVMDEQEIYGYKLLKDVPDQNNLVWYKTNPKYSASLFGRLRGTDWLSMLVKDSMTPDGRVAFLDTIDPKDAERLRLKPEKLKDPAAEMERIFQLAKSAPEGDQGVDASLLTKAEVRTLANRGLQFKLDKQGRRWATYRAENRKADAEAKRKAEAKAAEGPKVHPSKLKAEQRPSDIIDEILEKHGPILNKSAIKGGGGDNYKDGYFIARRNNPKSNVSGKRLFSDNGTAADVMADNLGMDVDQMWNEIDRAHAARAKWARGETDSQQQNKFWNAVDRQDGRTKSTVPMDSQQMQIGTKFKIEGEEFEVVDIDFEANEVTVKDGRKFGIQTIPDSAIIRADKGSVVVPENPVAFDPFAIGENAPAEPPKAAEPEPAPPVKPLKPEEPPAEGDGLKSMGGALFGEFEGGEGDYVSNMFAAIDRDLAAMGKPPMERGEPQTWDAANQRALAKMNRDPDWIPNLLSDFKEGRRTGALEPWENAGVVWYRARLRAEYNNALQRKNRAYEDGNPEGVLEAELDAQRFEDEMMAAKEVVGRGGTGTAAGLALQAQKMAAGDDFTLVEMRLDRRARQNDGAPLTEKQEAEVQALYDELEATRQAFEQFKKDADAKESGRLAKEALEQIEREKNKPKASDYVISVAEKWVKEWDKSAEAAKERLRKKGINVQMSLTVIDPSMLADYVLIGRAAIGRLGLDIAKFSQEMVATFGDTIKPHIQQIFDASRAAIEKVPMPAAVKKKILTKVKDMTPEQRKERLKEKLRDKFDQNKKNEITGIVQKIAREVVEDGARGWEAILDGVHAIIQGIDPEFTRRETMDAISGYGKYKRLSMDEISVALREGKGEMQQMAKIEDITSGVPPKPTGIERRKASDSEREKIKLVNELKKKHPELFEGSGLKSSLESRKTYYRNRTADLQAEINAREKLIKDKALSPTDAELEAIKAEYETVKAEWEAMFKKGLTDAQKIALVQASIERQIADLSRRIGAKDFTKKKPSIFSKAPELDAIKAERDALRAEFNALRDLDPEWQSEQRINKLEQDKASLERTIAEQERKLRENDLATKKQPVNRPADPALEPLKQQRDRLARQIADRRKKSPADKWAAAQAKRLEQMNKAIAEKEAKLAAGDLSTAPRPVNRPLAPDLEVARQRLDELNRQIADARKPKRSQADKDLQQFMARKTRQIVEWERRIREGDFEKKARREIAMTPEATELQGQAEAAKNKYLKARWDWAQSKRTTGKKIFDAIQKTRGAFVNIASSFDFSAPRQGLLTILSNITRLVTNPIQGTRMLGRPAIDMFKAWASDVKARGIEQRIKNRPNSVNGADRIAGIEYSALDSNNFTKYEENAHSVLDEWAALPLRTGNAAKTAATFIPKLGARGVRMSNRAFITFLNQTRAGLFDELLRVNFKDRPPTDAELKVIGNMVNIATGRGKLKPVTAQVASEVLWAPKLLASRVQFLTGQPLWTGKWAESARARKIVAKEYARIIIGGFLLATVARMFSDKKEDDPTSSDFGKIVRGKTRIDPWGGLQQVTTLIARTITASTKTLKGDVRSIGADKKYGQKQPWYVWADFIRSKLRPDIATAVDIGNRVLFDGKPVSPKTVATNLLIPLPMREIESVLKENGFTEGMIIQALGQFGAGVSVYENKESQR